MVKSRNGVAMQEQLDAKDVRRIIDGEHVPKRAVKQPPTRLEITIPVPPSETRPNARCHWAKKAKAVKQQRWDASVAAKVALMHGNYRAPEWTEATVQATFFRAKNGRTADSDNLIAWLKATFDSLQAAGIIANDRGLTHLPPIQRLGKDACGRNEVVLDVVGMNK
jgi:hypothetical protein